MGKTKTCGCYATVVIALVVLLRLGVGCHFLYEGLWKMNPANEFSSKGFLGMAKGPTKGLYYMFLPDLGGEERLRMQEAYEVKMENGQVVSKKRIGWTLPVIEKEWYNFYRQFREKYNLTDEVNADQLEEAKKIFDQYIVSLREYTLENREDIRAFVASKRRFEETLAGTKNNAEYQRIRNWDSQMSYRSEGEKFASEPVAMGANLRLDLWNILRDDQKIQGQLPEITYGSNKCCVMRFLAGLPWLKNFAKPSTMGALDLAVTLGLAAIGLCLILGFCTRLACLGGACFLINVVLSQFPWPTVYPYTNDMIGHAMVFNKDTIELCILLLLAILPSGRWAGLDWFVWTFCGRFVYRWCGIEKDPLVPECMNAQPEC